VLFFDEELRIRRFTRLIVDLFQFAESDIGRTLRTFRAPFTEFDLEAFLMRVMQNHSIEEAEVQDHSLRTWLLRAAGYPDQKGVVLSVISIARLRTGEYSGLQSRERILASAAPYAGDALLVIAPETGRIDYANRRASSRLGIPETAVEVFEISRFTPQMSLALWTSWLSTINIGASGHRLDVEFVDLSGQVVLVDVTATIVRDDDRAIAVLRIAENQDRAVALRELQERARAFAISNRELEQFASVVAHDLRAPLRHLNQFAKFLLTELGANPAPNVQEYLRIIQTSAAKMSGMIERLLDYARLGVGASRFGSVKLHDCIEQACEMVRGEIESSRLTLDHGRLPSVKGDRMLLTRLFQNLLSNAIKYARSGVAPRVVIEVEGVGETVVMKFADNGIGVQPGAESEIFKMFSRLHSDSEYDGNGMGLAICKRICKIHGGDIELDRNYGAGARFVINLPRSKGRLTKLSTL
jgi:signal transduction histidine kinase